MKYYLQVKDDKILSCSNCPVTDADITNMEIDFITYSGYMKTPEKYYIENGALKHYSDAQIEQEKINNLTMTALDFVNFLKQSGLSDLQIEQYLQANIAVKHQLEFCQNVYCGVAKALMPITYDGITITAEMVEQAFKDKHGVK